MHEVWVNAGRLRTRKNTANGIHTFCKTEIMAGPEIDAQFHFADIKTYFNSYTLTGRMNVSINDTFKQLRFRII